MRVAAAVAFCFLTGIVLGCSSGGAPSRLGERYVVKGKVTQGGKPVTKGQVVFTPLEAGKGDEQTGDLNAQGEYVTSLFAAKYKVSVTGNTAVPAALQSAKSTTLEIEISAAKSDANFDLK
jgi:hypothetical protein